MRIDGKWVPFSDGVTRPLIDGRGEFLGLTDPAASDLCVLGRDVTDNFDLILSRRRGDVILLAPTHEYRVILA